MFVAIARSLAITGCLAVALALPTRAADDQPVPVRVARALAAESDGTLRLTGTVAAEQRARLSPRVSGLVAKVHVDAGDRVESGDILVDLDHTFASLAVKRARATLEEARVRVAEAKRLKAEAVALLPKQFIPESEVLARSSAVDLAVAATNRLAVEELEAREVLERHSVVAPFAGVVAGKLTEVGEWVQTGSPLIDLVGTKNLRFDVRVPQERFGDVEVGRPATIRLDGSAGRAITGKVATKVPVNDPRARTFLVRIRLGDGDASILPGMSGEARFSLSGDAAAVLVPRDALVRTADATHRVWVVEPAGDVLRASSRPVTVGRSLAESVEVFGDLAAGVAVVVRGNETLGENQSVRVLDGD